MTPSDDDRAGALERALGLDDTALETEAERAEREDLEHRLAPLAGLLQPVVPDPELFARILTGIGKAPPTTDTHIVRSTEGHWKALCEGIEIKTLWHSVRRGRHAFLIRIRPGAILPAHEHAGDEECMVLEGDMVVDGETFGPGDFHVAFADTRHAVVTSRGGCLCLISVQLRVA
jgi:hypothetical protein